MLLKIKLAHELIILETYFRSIWYSTVMNQCFIAGCVNDIFVNMFKNTIDNYLMTGPCIDDKLLDT